MLIWLVLFLIIFFVSFLLALRSMNDYQEIPGKLSPEYSLFLIQRPEGLTAALIDNLFKQVREKHLILSFERLFKGLKTALVVFGPKSILSTVSSDLSLLEIEEYGGRANKGHKISAWEVGTKDPSSVKIENLNVDSYIPELTDNEEFWWQVVSEPDTSGKELSVAVRAVFLAADQKNESMVDDLMKIGGKEGLIALPQVYSTEQVVNFYKDRSLPKPMMTVGSRHNVLKIKLDYLLPLVWSAKY